MTSRSIRVWYLVHKWTSLICTLFLLMLCITGLPLIFHDEIDALAEDPPGYGLPGVGSSGEVPGLLPLDAMLARALAARPGEVPVFMAFDNDQPLMTVTTAPSPASPADRMTIQLFDRSTGEPMGNVDESGVMYFLLQLHTDMFLGLPGMLFLGAMGVLFTAAIASGLVLYAPFMRKLAFGTLRTARSRRNRGIEFSIDGEVTEGLRVIAGGSVVTPGSVGAIWVRPTRATAPAASPSTWSTPTSSGICPSCRARSTSRLARLC